MKFLTVAEVADMLKVSPKTVSQWAREDASMPVTRLPGRVIRYEEEALHRWLRSKTRRTAANKATEKPTE